MDGLNPQIEGRRHLEDEVRLESPCIRIAQDQEVFRSKTAALAEADVAVPVAILANEPPAERPIVMQIVARTQDRLSRSLKVTEPLRRCGDLEVARRLGR